MLAVNIFITVVDSGVRFSATVFCCLMFTLPRPENQKELGYGEQLAVSDKKLNKKPGVDFIASFARLSLHRPPIFIAVEAEA